MLKHAYHNLMKRITCVTLLLAFMLASCGKNKPKIIVILGNSITVCEPSPSLGWTHRWGMAASARDSDYVHLLIDSIHAHDPSAIIKFKQIGNFERDYQHYNLSTLDSFKKPYLLILRISENVNEKDATKNDFITYYDHLIDHLDAHKTLITDGFWNSNVNTTISKYADDQGIPFVRLSDLSIDSTNMAYGKFSNIGVQQHPSDKGMRKISARIWTVIKDYF
jgi:hypothetical protein